MFPSRFFFVAPQWGSSSGSITGEMVLDGSYMNEWAWAHIHETFVLSTIPSQNMLGWGSHSETSQLFSAWNECVDVKSEIYKDVGSDIPSGL